MSEDLLTRLHRIYAAVNDALEADLSKFPPAFIGNDKVFGVYQDFMGGLSHAQVQNLANSIIRNIATFRSTSAPGAERMGATHVRSKRRSMHPSRFVC